MKYKEINIPDKELFRKKIKELYGRDIANAECHFSSRNYTFLFNGLKPSVIRVSANTKRKISDIKHEMEWLDDLRKYISDITYIIPSLTNSIAEEFSIDDNEYCVSQFKLIHGEKANAENRDDQYFYIVGKLLGKIHSISYKEQKEGLKFNRCKWYEKNSFDFSYLKDYVSSEILSKLHTRIEKIKSYPEVPETFGMIHGDFQVNNILIEWDNAKSFNFDNCCYGYYMSDITTAIFSFIVDPETPLENNRNDLFFSYLEPFRKGYETEFTLPDTEWNKVDDFVCLRIFECACMLSRTNTDTVWKKGVINRLINTASADNCLEAFDTHHKNRILGA